jgi:hypothetical protein
MTNSQISVERLSVSDDLILVGPDSSVDQLLMVPKSFHYRVFGLDLPSLEVEGVFDGDRLQITSLRLSASAGLTAVDLIKVKLPEIIFQVARHSIPNAEHWLKPDGFIDALNSSKQRSYPLLAQAYWYHHLSWGAPRQYLMDLTGWSRNNTNFHLRQISSLIGLPESRKKASERQVIAQQRDRAK